MIKGLLSHLLLVLCLLPYDGLALAAEGLTPPSTESAFMTGVQLFQKNDFEKARENFEQVLAQEPQSVLALTNLALVQLKLGKKGWAVANLRKALEIEPDQVTTQEALKFALTQLEVKEIPHNIEGYETLRTQFLQPVTLAIYLGLAALFLFSTGWSLLAYVGKRRRALMAEEALPRFPLIGAILSLGLLFFGGLSALKIYDKTLTRGTIVDDKTTVQASPGENQVTLFDLHAGFEVIVQKTSGDWVQVTYPGASTGWIKKSAMLITSSP